MFTYEREEVRKGRKEGRQANVLQKNILEWMMLGVAVARPYFNLQIAKTLTLLIDQTSIQSNRNLIKLECVTEQTWQRHA